MIAPDPYGAFVDRVASPAAGSGPLGRVLLAVKDNIAVAGHRWTAGLPLFADRTASRDAACVARLRAAGACIVGVTATDSAGFGMMTPDVANPIAPERTAGGSSGGSAAAVAAGLADLALGTDTGGSVRVPAACCGVYGLKPTYGRVAMDGVTPLSPTFDHVGLLAADLDILEAGWRALSPDNRKTRATPVRSVGFDPARLAAADAAPRDGIAMVLARLAERGIAVREIVLPGALEIAEVHGAIVCAEALEIWHEHWPREADRFTPTARKSLSYAAQLTRAEIALAQSRLSGLRAAIARPFDEVDAIVGPTLAIEPPRVGARTAVLWGETVPVVFALLAETVTFDVSGHPALAMPHPAMTAAGTPVSVQIATRPDAELHAIELARVISGYELS